MRPLFGWHRWTPVATEHIRDMSFGEPGIKMTRVLYQRNGKTKVRRMAGWWHLTDLQA